MSKSANKITVNYSNHEAQKLEEIKRVKGFDSLSQVFEEAVKFYALAHEEHKTGTKFFIRDINGTETELDMFAPLQEDSSKDNAVTISFPNTAKSRFEEIQKTIQAPDVAAVFSQAIKFYIQAYDVHLEGSDFILSNPERGSEKLNIFPTPKAH